MAATTFPVATGCTARRSLARTLAIYVKEAKYELLKNVRIPVYAISTIAFPLMFYVLFGIVLGRNNAAVRNDNATYMLATMGCFGVMAVSLFGFGVSLAIERGQGWLQVKRASPMPVARVLLRQAVCGGGVQHGDHVAAAGRRDCLRRRSPAGRDGGETDRHSGRRIDSVQRDGTGDRLLRQAELGAGSGQPDLPCRCRSARACGFRCSCCRMDCRRSRKFCPRIT